MTGLLGANPSHSRRASEGTARAKWEIFSDLMDDLKAKLAAQALTFDLAGEMPGGYLSTKIAFGRILDEADLSGSPVAYCWMRCRSPRRDMQRLLKMHFIDPSQVSAISNVRNYELSSQAAASRRGWDDSLTGRMKNPEFSWLFSACENFPMKVSRNMQ